MKKLLFALLTTCMLPLLSPAQENAFQAGEKINYTVFYNVIGIYVNAGTASFTTSRTTYDNQDVFHVVGEGRTNARYDWIFKVRDRYESFFHVSTMKPVKFIRNIQEGGYKKQEEVIFDHKSRKARTKKGNYDIPGQVQDVVSSMYYARNLNYDRYKPGDKIPFAMFLDDEVYNIYIKYEGKETVKTRYGKFRAIKLKPLLLKGNIFDGGEKMTVWVTDDENHIPVRIESPISVGSIKVDLKNHENLKYPLTAMASN